MTITTKTIYVAGNGQQFDSREAAERYENAHEATMAIDDGRFTREFDVEQFPLALLALQDRGWQLIPPPENKPSYDGLSTEEEIKRVLESLPGQMSR